jgi:hypothetical protein
MPAELLHHCQARSVSKHLECGSIGSVKSRIPEPTDEGTSGYVRRCRRDARRLATNDPRTDVLRTTRRIKGREFAFESGYRRGTIGLRGAQLVQTGPWWLPHRVHDIMQWTS